MAKPNPSRTCTHYHQPVKQDSDFLRARLQDGADARTGYIITVPQPLTSGTTTVSMEAVERATVMEFNGAANRFERSLRKKSRPRLPDRLQRKKSGASGTNSLLVGCVNGRSS